MRKLIAGVAACLSILALTAQADIYIDSVAATATGESVSGSTRTVVGLVASTASINNLQLPDITAGSVLMGGGTTPVTGTGVLTNGQLIIGDGTGVPSVAVLTQDSANRVVVSNGAGTITLSGPQDIGTTSTPQFARIGIGGASTAGFGVYAPFSGSAAAGSLYASFNFLTAATAGANTIAGQFNQVYAVGNGSYPAGIFGNYSYATMDGGESIGTAADHGAGTWALRGDIYLPAGSTSPYAGGLYVKDTSVMTAGERYGVYADTPSVTVDSWFAFYGIGLDNGTTMVLKTSATVANITAADTFISFRSSTNSVVGSIAGTAVAGTIAYNVTSDRRLKKNIVDAVPAGSLLDSLKIRSFDYKAGGHQRYGVIAQELEPVFPEAVSVGGADVDKTPWQVDYSKLVPVLVKEIQDLRRRVAELERR